MKKNSVINLNCGIEQVSSTGGLDPEMNHTLLAQGAEKYKRGTMVTFCYGIISLFIISSYQIQVQEVNEPELCDKEGRHNSWSSSIPEMNHTLQSKELKKEK